MTITPEIEREFMAQYRRTRSPFKAANAVGISPSDGWAIVDKHKDDQFQERHNGQGRPELRPFLVASRRAQESGWNNRDDGVRAARDAHEAGTHVLCTGRDGPWLLLYSIPRKGPKQPKPGYFLPEGY